MSVLLLSGGLDSLVMLAACAKTDVLCMTFFYGQKHAREIEHAERIADAYKSRHMIVDISGAFPPCPMTGAGVIPAGKKHDDPAQSATVVPNRNAVMISVAASWASTHRDKFVLIGCHASDHAVYQDCRPKFLATMGVAVMAGCGASLKAPFAHKTRREVVEIGRLAGVDFSLAWSCYEGGDKPCGACGACVERQEAGA
jgi:7-cyano-7-deazaguanine synthase